MRRWKWLVLSVVGLSIVAAWLVATRREALEGGSSSVDEAVQSSAEAPESAHSAAGTGSVTEPPPSMPAVAKLTDDDFLNRQKPVPGKLLEVLAELVPRAEAGDAAAAFQIYVKVNDCKSVLEGSTSARQAAGEAASAAEKARLTDTLVRLENCEGITQDLIDSRAKWLTMAADRGDPLAQLTYAADATLIVGGASQMIANPRAVEDYKKKSLNFLTGLADRGEVSAILQLCNAYSMGILVPKDDVKAYAYAYLANLITGKSQNLVQAIGVSLTNEQMQKGQQIAISLHRRCCG